MAVLAPLVTFTRMRCLPFFASLPDSTPARVSATCRGRRAADQV